MATLTGDVEFAEALKRALDNWGVYGGRIKRALTGE